MRKASAACLLVRILFEPTIDRKILHGAEGRWKWYKGYRVGKMLALFTVNAMIIYINKEKRVALLSGEERAGKICKIYRTLACDCSK